MIECLRDGRGWARKRDDARSRRPILPWRGTGPGIGMLGLAFFLLLTLSACAASPALPLPPSPPAQPPVASVAPAPAAHAQPRHAPPLNTATEHARAEQPPAAGTPLMDKSAETAGFSLDMIAKARRAMQAITKLNSLFAAEMATTSDPKIQGAIYADFQKKYMDAVKAQGLTMSAYLQLLNAAAKNPGLSQALSAPDSSSAQKPAAAAPAAPTPAAAPAAQK